VGIGVDGGGERRGWVGPWAYSGVGRASIWRLIWHYIVHSPLVGHAGSHCNLSLGTLTL
jgi:hypothetical protein